jgi:ribonuclease HII
MNICGIDEAGRGPIAGPVVVAAVVFPRNFKIDGVKDSKKLSESKREYFYDLILDKCLAYDVQIVDNYIIDEINILKSTMLGIQRCLEKLKIFKEKVMIDGNYFILEKNRHFDYNYNLIVKGDEKVFHISSASILAKVARDRIMVKMHELYPQYNFLKNKGYPTREHIEAVKKNGITRIHRKTFCKKYL